MHTCNICFVYKMESLIFLVHWQICLFFVDMYFAWGRCVGSLENMFLSEASTNVHLKNKKIKNSKHVVDQTMAEWSRYFSSPLQDMKSNLTLHITGNIQDRVSRGLFVNFNARVCEEESDAHGTYVVAEGE